MNDGAMANSDVFTHCGSGQLVGEMNDGAVLDVATGADFDWADIATQNTARPNADLCANCDLADEHGVAMNEGRRIDYWSVLAKGFNHRDVL